MFVEILCKLCFGEGVFCLGVVCCMKGIKYYVCVASFVVLNETFESVKRVNG